MKKIQVLGAGCIKCKKLIALCEQVLEEMNLDLTVEKVTDINEIMDFGVMATPALVIDDEVKFVGKVPSIKILRELFRTC